MDGEGSNQDYKLTFDMTDAESKLKLVKDIVAISNAGGGQIVFGRDEVTTSGIDPLLAKALDSARLADIVQKYTKPARINLAHEIHQLDSDSVLLTIRIEAAEYPLVMAEDGNFAHQPSGKTRPAFAKGEIWTRHSSKNERVTYDDMRAWIEKAKKEERGAILNRINKVIDIPEGADIQIVHPSSVPALDTPQRMLEYAAKRRASKPSYVLPADDLMELFQHRTELQPSMTPAELSLIVASALRRPSTLFWWLTLLDGSPELILDELDGCLTSTDRDKSDAATSVIELAAIYADDERLKELIAKLLDSRYKHFREAAQRWGGQSSQIGKLQERIQKAKCEQNLLSEMTIDDLEKNATLFAEQYGDGNAAQARRLGDVTRVIWSKRSVYAKAVFDKKE